MQSVVTATHNQRRSPRLFPSGLVDVDAALLPYRFLDRFVGFGHRRAHFATQPAHAANPYRHAQQIVEHSCRLTHTQAIASGEEAAHFCA